MKTGIYKIESIENNKFYIGSAVNIKVRWSRHLRDLSNNKHHSIYLQRHYNKYGIDDLKFSVLEECTAEELLTREQYYLDNFICLFNNAKVAGSCLGSTRTQEQKDRMSEYTKGVNNPTYGLERTVEWRDSISKANKGQIAWNKGKTNIYSENTLKQIKISALNREKVQCPYCNNYIIPQNYSRWHGEKCDYKDVPIGMKKCACCKTIVHKDNFSKNKTQLDGYNRICKQCVKIK